MCYFFIMFAGIIIFVLSIELSHNAFWKGRKKLGVCLVCLAISALLLLLASSFSILPQYFESKNVIATVSGKGHQNESTLLIPIRMGNTFTYTRNHSPEKFLVVVTYDGITDTINSSELYNTVQEGDTVEVILRTGYDKNQQIVCQDLLIPQD